MARFESLKHVPAETRTVLRERFSRNLQGYRDARAPTQAERVFDDELVLKLFQHLKIARNDTPERASELYDELRKTDPGALSIQELVADGWVACGWRCLNIPGDVGRAIVKEGTGKFATFAAWRKMLYESDYRLRTISDGNPDLVELAESVASGARLPTDIACHTPTRVAARLWDRDERHHTGSPDFLFEWLQAWELLNPSELIPSDVWREDARKHFEMAALAVLENDARPLSWNEYRQRGVLQLARARGGDNARFASFLPPVPKTLVARAVWLVDNRMEFIRFENGAWRHAASLITLLLTEVEHCEHARAPHPVASRVLDLAMNYPEVLSSLLFFVDQRPSLLADMALKPETSALACLLISKWRVAFGAWDRQLTVRDNETARSEAFIDALSVMCHHAQSGRLEPAEVAALLYQLHVSVAYDDDASSTGNVTLAALRSELVGFSRSVLVSIFNALVCGDYETEVGLPAFSAALDLVEVGQLIPDIDCSRLVGAYVESIGKQSYLLSATRISPDGAAMLFEMSEKLGGQTQQEFLYPLDVSERLASSVASDENQFAVEQELARTLRVHMRVLARAVIGQRDCVPPPLVAALAEAISLGAVADSDKGRIAAFSARYERPPTGPAREAGLAEDFGRALRCVPDTDGERLLKEILEIGEPAFLAQLCGSVPLAMQSAIRERIRQLVPSEADNAWFFTDLHFRIDELIAIGEYITAEAYIACEPEPPKPLAGRFALVRLRHRLQLALATKDWLALEKATIPPDLQQADTNAARDTILFYRAVAQFTKEGGDIAIAEHAFAALHGQHRGVPEYGFNLFAAKLGRLVRNHPFASLRGQDLARARELVLEAEQMESAYDLTKPNADSYLGNKAILLFVLGRTREAAELLRGIFLTRMTDRIGAYLSVALARLGRMRDALATLDVAEESLGTSDLLRMARAHLTEGRPVVRVSLFYAVDADGSRVPGSELNNNDIGRWLWFHPAVVEAVMDRCGGQITWYTRDTGAVACPPDYLTPFGVNSAGLVNVTDSDIAKLDVWQQRVWVGHNVTPEGAVSGELLASRVRAEPADTVAPEQKFLDLRRHLNQLTEQWCGGQLFSKHDSESAILKSIHRFRALDAASLLGLAKDITRITADIIDIRPLRQLKAPPSGTKWGSLKQLEMALGTVTDAANARSALTHLVGVYELRLGDAHLPSSKIEEAFALVGIDRQASPMQQASQMIEAAASSLLHICEIITSSLGEA
ncbi:hypothetical protein [Burkholderia pseudomallei]|uniref:hypothetical protein n=1 Tax=Burkholderia pseudomallei TaxID=28450 RepID=UPI001AD6186B|nr:hypothetical protein [Burkholderia pseudomallei]MBO7825943.1 hypothetical protein [Burkholderia pseudomallei]